LIDLESAKEKFAALITEQLKRVERMKNEEGFINFQEIEPIIIGIAGGDGIGPSITSQARRILAMLVDKGIIYAKGANRNRTYRLNT